ncbi:MAG: MFS transporter, partial [Candidatus Geothermarchaeales archaeon]
MPRLRVAPPFLASLSTIYFFIGFGFFSFALLVPLYGDGLGLSYTVIGLLSSSFNLASMIFAPLLGALSDRLLKRKGFLVAG